VRLRVGFEPPPPYQIDAYVDKHTEKTMRFSEYQVVHIDGHVVKPGGIVNDFRGNPVILHYITKAPDTPSTGRVYIHEPGKPDSAHEVYPSVIKCVIRLKPDSMRERDADGNLTEEAFEAINDDMDEALLSAEKGVK
jgi:hypothetical protein